jgi:hypothetical protein
MLPDTSVQTLKALHLHGMAQALDELARQGSPLYHEALPFLTTLLKAEVAERAVRSTAYQMKAARFPAYRDLSSFDFAQSPVDEALVRQLHRGEFMQEAHNVVLVGGPVPAKPTSPQRSVCRPSPICTGVIGSSPPLNWSMHSNRKRPPASKAPWPRAWRPWIW